MNEKFYELQALQVQREEQLNSREFKKWKKEINEQALKADGSNTPIARQWKKACFEQIVESVKAELADPQFIRSGAATQAIKDCLNISVTYKKDRKTGEKIVEAQPEKNFFDLDLAIFVTLQLMLDNCLSPEFKVDVIDKSTGKDRVCYPSVDQDKLFKKVGERVELNIAFQFVKECFPKYFQKLDQICEGGNEGQPRSSSYYWRYNMKRALKNKAETLRQEGKHEEADRLEWKPFGANSRHIGAWLVTRCLKHGYIYPSKGPMYKLFDTKTRQIGPKKKATFIVLSPDADRDRSNFAERHEPYIQSSQPMLCPPAAADNDHWGHWLLGQHMAAPASHKGALNISDDMLAYINRLQKVPYKINPFILAVMNKLDEQNIGLGKFKPHCYVEPKTVAESLGIVGDYESQSNEMALYNDDEKKDAKRTRSLAIGHQIEQVQKGRAAKLILQSANDLVKHQQFYYPYQWDFRGRAYCRCMTAPQPQGPDYSKAAIKFAIEQPIDNSSKRYLAIELANNAGKDKISFGERVEWVTRNEHKIILVATMMNDDGKFTDAISYLESMSEPFQFLAAAEEYYHCFIKGDRHTTSVRCGVDMSCSAAGIHAAWKLDEAAAELVNVTPGSRPNDLYINVWRKLLDVNKKQLPPPIRPHLLDQLTDSGWGRKIAKKMIMVYQYSAGLPKQMLEFRELHDSEDFPQELRLHQEEINALWKLWPQATSKVMSVESVIKWFQARVTELHKLGKTEVLIPNATGAIQVMKYPLYNIKRIKSFHNGLISFREPTGEADLKGWKKAVLANATHMTDAAILSIALRDFKYSFSTVHDAAYCYATDAMSDMLSQLKLGFVEAVQFNIWNEFRQINGLDPNDPHTSFPQTNTLNLKDVVNSSYLFA